MISGSVQGPLFSLANRGQQGCAATSEGKVKVLLTGVAITDPALASRERQGILIKVLEGNAGLLIEGVTLDFGEHNDSAKNGKCGNQ